MDSEAIGSRTKIAQVGFGIFWCFTTAGVVFGYPALKPILQSSGVYSHLCDGDEKSCAASDLRLNFMFTVATVITNGCALPAGSLLDRYGPRITTILGSIIFLLGNLLFGLGFVEGAFDSYLVGYGLIALGSVCIFLSQFHLSNVFPKYSGVILAALTGAFDASSVPYLIYREIYFAFGNRPSLRIFFLLYTLLPVVIIFQQIISGPPYIYVRTVSSDSFMTSADEEDLDELARARSPRRLDEQLYTPSSDPVASGFSRLSYSIPSHPNGYVDDEENIELLDKGKGDGVIGAMFGISLKDQLTSSWFWVICAYLCVAMIRTNWYLATVQSQLEWYTTDSLADTLTRAFTVLLPLGGIIGIPFVGMLLDTRPALEASWVLLVFGILFGVLTVIPSTIPQLAGIGVLVFNRPLLYTFISDLTAKVFGFSSFGKIYGLLMTLSGAVGLALTPMDILTKHFYHGDYTPMNILLLVAGIATNVALIGRIYAHTRYGRITLVEDY